MIRTFSLLAGVILASPVAAAAPAMTSAVVVPALEQCILAATARTGGDGSGPLITDCISVGSAACQNEGGTPSNALVIRCDVDELIFWNALLAFETAQLQKSVQRAGLADLRALQKVWLVWKSARCDLVRKSEQDAARTDVDVSFCVMETTALRAIDLMAAL